jgi:Asp-tRNA(Asn)/Glu-tRNA(Gln) amidotransferase A subunit family amidase
VNHSLSLDRRRVLAALATVGVGSAAWQRALAQQVAADGQLTLEMLEQAEWIAGLAMTPEQREAIRDRVQRQLDQLKELRAISVPHEVPPAVQFSVLGAHRQHDQTPTLDRSAQAIESMAGERPNSDRDLAFLPVTELAALLRRRAVTSVELTELYLERLKAADPVLKCVVTLTEDLARKQAAQADRELAQGLDRGVLHGIPWGAKDLIAYPGYPTTWGATPLKEQRLPYKATVAQRLDDAGAVLVAKLSLGALAMGDRWFGQKTLNPWNLEQGSSGSSAGSAAATAAGLVGFSLGSETLGSIISPSRRCGVTGLRPTFGRVSRAGCMTLTWSMDKIGPIARTAQDCALILAAIHGADARDATTVNRPFHWPPRTDPAQIRIGFVQEEADRYHEEIRILRELGFQLVPINVSQQFPVWAVATLLDVEAATVFDEFTRQNITQDLNDWPDIFRTAELIPAVEYLRANRIRTQMMHAIERDVFSHVDLYLGREVGDDLAYTNLTGHPSIVMPNGPSESGGSPKSFQLTGCWFGEEALLTVAHAYQQATGHHLNHPTIPAV